MNYFKELIDQRNDYFETSKQFVTHYGWDKSDARIGIFPKCMNSFEPVLFSLDFAKKDLSSKNYHAKFSKDGKTPPPDDEIQKMHDYYLMYIQYSFSMLFFAAIESSFRVFVRAIDSFACQSGEAEFQSIHKWLLNKTNQQKHDSLMELWRLIRNCHHNNGTYVSIKNPHQVIFHNGNNYEFKHGESITFVDMDFLLSLTKDTKKMLDDVIQSEPLVSISQITDPTYHIMP